MKPYPEFAKDLESLHPAQLLTLEEKAKASESVEVLSIIAKEWARRRIAVAKERAA